ncbi:MAG: YncE family protein [Actinobacteria bacterium]|nr:MAG: YncE family protein [Actinomycetota bacterium]
MSARYRLGSGVGLVTCALGLALASVTATAIAADSIYWSNSGGKIRVGNLNGSGTPMDLFSTSEHSPYGVAINPRAGKIYWANAVASGKIRVGNLNGSGTPMDLFPTTTEDVPFGVAIDPAAGKIYWANDVSAGKIRVGNLNGGGTPTDLFSTSESGPEGVAIDPAAGKIYWANDVSGKIRVGNLNGSGTPADLFPTTEDSPTGVAIDPTAGKIYWTNYTSGIIRVGNLNGSGTPMDLFPAESSSPVFTALLRAPLTLASPTVAGGARVGSLLSCSRGAWAGDLLGAFLYRAPLLPRRDGRQVQLPGQRRERGWCLVQNEPGPPHQAAQADDQARRDQPQEEQRALLVRLGRRKRLPVRAREAKEEGQEAWQAQVLGLQVAQDL